MIKVGDKVPSVRVKHMTANGPAEITTDELFKGKIVVVFGLPGAFTPTCSAKHVPGYLAKSADLKAKGVDTIACLSVNDAFVMGAWGKDQRVEDKILMLADGSAQLTKALGLELDLTPHGMGMRSKRFAMVVKDGVVKHLAIEENPGALDVSAAEKVMAHV
ncbi:MAG TPA: peroxiredoxin [Kiloniellales bacterium]|nr:peroxiredoxin [Kiloniellales bacterium]